MSRRRYLSKRNDAADPYMPATGAQKHQAVPLPGCVMHGMLHIDAIAWISRTLRCVQGDEKPQARHFRNFHATLKVQTFDDIDQCVKIATTALALAPEATLGLRELAINAVEHGNLEIDFDHKSELLAGGTWQNEIERRLASAEYCDRFASVELLRNGEQFTIHITDQGPGFNWRQHLDDETAPKHMLHGRGMSIAMAGGFDSLAYDGVGNQVTIRGACVPDQSA